MTRPDDLRLGHRILSVALKKLRMWQGLTGAGKKSLHDLARTIHEKE